MSPETPKQNSTESEGVGGGTKEKRQDSSPILQVELQVPKAITDRYDASRKANKRSDCWRLTVEILTFLAVVGYTTVAYFQLSAIRDTLNVTRDVSRTEQRAWIAITATGHTLQIERPISVAIRLQNLGKTPARKYDGYAVTETTQGNKEPSFIYKGTGRIGGRMAIPVVLPNANVDADIPAGEKGPNGAPRVVILKQPVLDEINTGRRRLFVHGRGDYEDFFGVHHWITFCFVYAPGVATKDFVNCQGNNDIDSGRD